MSLANIHLPKKLLLQNEFQEFFQLKVYNYILLLFLMKKKKSLNVQNQLLLIINLKYMTFFLRLYKAY